MSYNLWRKHLYYFILINLMSLFSISAFADGASVDKVYHPYVLSNEREVEWRMFSRRETEGTSFSQRFAYGQSVADDVMLEFYLLGERDVSGDFNVIAYELETRWMATDQGEYWADWGMLFELEKEDKKDNWEATTGVLVEKEFGKTSLTLNAFLVYQWGESVANEFETDFRLKYRYRYIEQFQPAVEIYAGEEYFGVGPAFMGLQRFSSQKQLKWEFGFITGLDSRSKGHVLRMTIEYEF